MYYVFTCIDDNDCEMYGEFCSYKQAYEEVRKLLSENKKKIEQDEKEVYVYMQKWAGWIMVAGDLGIVLGGKCKFLATICED